MSDLDRRQMLKIAAELTADTGAVERGRLDPPTWTAPTKCALPAPSAPLPPSDRVGFAVVGLGRLTTGEIMPAFAQKKRAKLGALISGTPEQAKLLAEQYGVPPDAVYGHGDWDRIGANPAIRAVCVVTPNALQREATLAATVAGKHVLCEKPMATSSVNCRSMIEACARAGRALMIAYRCQYEPNNRTLEEVMRDRRYGAALLYDALNTQTWQRRPRGVSTKP